ncbi:hypothetical protein, partial [Pseudomonas savastanoi]
FNSMTVLHSVPATAGFGVRDLDDVDHLTMIRNIMSHNDGEATEYQKTLCKTGRKNEFEKRLVKAIKRTEGVKVNIFNGLIVDERFLTYAVTEFSRYAAALEKAIQRNNR